MPHVLSLIHGLMDISDTCLLRGTGRFPLVPTLSMGCVSRGIEGWDSLFLSQLSIRIFFIFLPSFAISFFIPCFLIRFYLLQSSPSSLFLFKLPSSPPTSSSALLPPFFPPLSQPPPAGGKEQQPLLVVAGGREVGLKHAYCTSSSSPLPPPVPLGYPGPPAGISQT